MSNEVKPYESATGKKEQVSQMFDNIAPSYDFLNRFLSLGIDTIWRKIAITKVLATKPKYVLDIATGTGDMAIEMAKRDKNVDIVGIDISDGMLDIGRKKIAKIGLSDRISMRNGDAENLPFEDNTFDGAFVSFGVRNFENLDKGLSDILRVMKKGGRLIVLEFTKPKVFPIKQIFQLYFRYLLPLLGKLQSRDPRAYAYLFESVQVFPEREAFVEILKNNGYRDITKRSLTFGICHIYQCHK